MYRTNHIEIMKKLHLLKTLVDLLWFFSIIVVIALGIFLPILFFSDKPLDIPLKVNDTEIIMNLSAKFLISGFIIAYFCFLYGLFLFRKVLVHFSKREIFSTSVIKLLDKIGKFFLLASVFATLTEFASQLYFENEVELGFEGGFFDSFLFTASLGLFFMVLSEVFAIGKNIKEENELTI